MDRSSCTDIQIFVRLMRAVRDASLPNATKDAIYRAVELLACDIASPAGRSTYAHLGQMTHDDPAVREVVGPYLPALARLLRWLDDTPAPRRRLSPSGCDVARRGLWGFRSRPAPDLAQGL